MILEWDWQFNVLDIYNYRVDGPRKAYFDFIRNNADKIEGDIVEAGVFKGRSLLAAALLLKELGSDKLVHGYDTFSGFPPVYHEFDDISAFDNLYANGKITETHYQSVKSNAYLRQQLSLGANDAEHISNSGDFSKANKEMLLHKIDLLGLDNIVLHEGVFENTMNAKSNLSPKKIFACMIDCDLYNSYMTTFEFIWPILEEGGFVYLDEYFALKFPGARIASDEFLEKKTHTKYNYRCSDSDLFERHYVIKNGS